MVIYRLASLHGPLCYTEPHLNNILGFLNLFEYYLKQRVNWYVRVNSYINIVRNPFPLSSPISCSGGT